MVFLLVAIVVLCSLVLWFVAHFGLDVVNALLVVAMMTLTWHLGRRRPGRSMADDFGYW